MSDSVIQCQGLFKTFTEGPQDVEVLKGIDISIAKGERVAIVGASGSGKSTLLHLLGGLDVPTAGDIQVMGQTMSAMGENYVTSHWALSTSFTICWASSPRWKTSACHY